jgi:hypothetical protein
MMLRGRPAVLPRTRTRKDIVSNAHRTVLVTLALLAAACSGEPTASRGFKPSRPRFTITTSTVTCPDTISVGQSAQCTAYFYDENHNLVSTAATWSSTNTAVLTVGTTGIITGVGVGTATVQATAGGVTESKSVYVKPGLTVSIGGPSPVQKFDTCDWVAYVSGGTSPYSYSWHVSSAAGTPTDDYWEGYLIGGSSTMSVTVTDANGVQKTVSRNILAAFNAPLC